MGGVLRTRSVAAAVTVQAGTRARASAAITAMEDCVERAMAVRGSAFMDEGVSRHKTSCCGALVPRLLLLAWCILLYGTYGRVGC